MKKCLLSLCAFLLLAPSAIQSAEPPKGLTPLFNGRNLDGWEGPKEVFTAKDGAIVAGALEHPVAHNDFLCTTREYGDFELRLKAKLNGPGNNAGVQFRSKRVPNHFEVSGYQADMGSFGKDNVWGGLYDESRRNKFLATPDQAALAKVFRAGEWNDLVIRCDGSHITIQVNGLKTVDYTETDPAIARSGIIGVQIHGGQPAEAQYRDLFIKELKPAAK